MMIVSMNTERDCVMPWLTGWRTSAVAATFGTEPSPASFENSPRRSPWASATPMPPPIASSSPNAPLTIETSTPGTSGRLMTMTTAAISR